jgi:hypothetical protein
LGNRHDVGRVKGGKVMRMKGIEKAKGRGTTALLYQEENPTLNSDIISHSGKTTYHQNSIRRPLTPNPYVSKKIRTTDNTITPS